MNYIFFPDSIIFLDWHESLWIHYLLWIKYGSMMFFVKSLWIQYHLREFIIFLRKLIICYVNLVWIYYLFRKLNINFVSFSRIHDELVIFFVNSELIYHCDANWLINSLFSSLILQLFRVINPHSQFVLQIYYEFTIFWAKSLRIHYLFREDTLNSLSISQIYSVFANSFWFKLSLLWNHYELNIFSRLHYFFSSWIFVSRNHYEST